MQAALAVASVLLVGGYRLLALRQHWFDVPNARSSHAQPVPRGAGIAFAALMVVAVAILWIRGDTTLAWSLAPAFVVALTGWWDDLRGVSARLRFAIYLLCCVATVAVVFASSSGTTFVLLLTAATVVALLWFVNLYNFMDGINGIAACEGLFIGIAALWLSAGLPQASSSHFVLATLLAVLLGFLPWNFPRARVFMGDAGSAFLGFLFGALALNAIVGGWLTLWQCLLLGGVFIVDATYTLVVRIASGQRWHEAHRSHAYQRLADRYKNHAPVVLLATAINVLWLLPWAWIAGRWTGYGWACVIGAYAPLVWCDHLLRAGRRLA